MTTSVLTKRQVSNFTQFFDSSGEYFLKLTFRFDDDCGNGHNSFSITAELELPDYSSYGCIIDGDKVHQIIKETLPLQKFEHLLKWHLCSTDQPLHYVANTVYWAKQGELENARSSAIWEDATLEQLSDKKALLARLPALLEEFQSVIEGLGFTY